MKMDFDVLIIGSGAGGGMTALRLCEAGFKVGLIERGPKYDPRKDYILNYPDWDQREDPLQEATFREQSIDQTYLTKVTDHKGRERPRNSLRYYRVHGLGGSTLHYQGEAHRFPEHAFTTRSDFGWGVDWPITYADLAPYYEQAENLLGVSGETGNPHKPPRGEFPNPAHPLSKRSELLAEAAKAAGMTVLPNTLALPSRPSEGRPACQHSGGCNYGCIFNAKSSIDQAIVPRAEKTGNLTILTETRAMKLELDDEGEIAGVNCLSGKSNSTITAKRYVLAAGALETPRLMLASVNQQHSEGYANGQDQVGRYFMETVVARLNLNFKDQFPVYRGPPLDSRIWDYSKPADRQTSGFVLGAAGYLYPQIGPSRHAISTPGIGRAHKKEVRESFGRNVYLFGIAEQVPLADNRITLSNRLDRAGMNRVKVHCAYNEQDEHTVSKMEERLDAWAKATAHTRIFGKSNSVYRSSATHIGGTCRMGNDPKESVVDAFGNVHGQSNCYITDASVFVTQGCGDSPSLTIQALALRTADRIAADLKADG